MIGYMAKRKTPAVKKKEPTKPIKDKPQEGGFKIIQWMKEHKKEEKNESKNTEGI